MQKLKQQFNIRAQWVRWLVLLLSLLVTTTFAWKLQHSQDKALQAELTFLLRSQGALLQQKINHALATPSILRAIVATDTVSEPLFNALARELLENFDGSESVQLAPKGIIQYAFPPGVDDSVIGHDLFNTHGKRDYQPGMMQSIKTGQVVLDGPRELYQGGRAIIARQPLYQGDEFWGFSIVILRFPEFLGLDALTTKEGRELSFDIWRKQDQNYRSLLNYQNIEDFGAAERLPLTVADQQWELGIRQQPPLWAPALALKLFLALLVSLVFAELCRALYLLRAHKHSLLELVNEQTVQIRQREQSLERAQQAASIGSWQYFPDTDHKEFSPQGLRTLQLHQPLTHAQLMQQIAPAHRADYQKFMEYHGLDTICVEYELQLHQGSIWLREYAQWSESDACLVGTVQDITAELELQRKIWRQANVDQLTGLKNKNYLLNLSEEKLNLMKADVSNVLVAVFDIDHLKRINDSLGIRYGDQLLLQVAQRLKEKVGHLGTVFRLAGDEFLVGFELSEQSQPEALIKLLQQITVQPFVLFDSSRFITASIGWALWPRDGQSIAEILVACTLAAHKAKLQGRNMSLEYAPEMTEAARLRDNLEAELRAALLQDQMHMLYQPIVNAATGKLESLEALIRWHHPKLGLVSPDKFIPIAEESGLILGLGQWIFETVARDCHLLRQTLGPGVRCSINVSRVQLVDSNFSHYVSRNLLSRFPKDQQLTFEITESALIRDSERAADSINALCSQQLAFAIDDFGVGYSSLSSLREFKVSNLKIDKSFISHCTHNASDRTLLNAMIEMAHSLGMTTTAEGIETEEQRALLQELGCDLLQGYLFSRPVTIEEIAAQGWFYPVKQLKVATL
ncbi:EAL domain-containing protein [Shewanella cyperi]|uniref:EAL domain-containing protein n=1 Tax=Shewanella cyperi TaxID=2814292 RepID=A0A974XML8_9GAMM|nr:EAL domain-containing protein [Shewanella cyperi]QSX30058.1 EAL domain-containing protein [Shewanella cyperi]